MESEKIDMIPPPPLLGIGNRILAALPEDDLGELRPHLELVALSPGQVLLHPDVLIQHVYFLEHGLVSLVHRLEDGGVVQTGLVGSEGLVGALAPLGASAFSGEAMVQIGGPALRMRAGALRVAAALRPALRDLLLRYVQALFAQVTQSVACNGRHGLRQRLARWLLMAHDFVDLNELPITHEFLATMLGVRRAGVTEGLAALKEAGLIDTARRRIVILDRPGLERTSCECYGIVAAEYARLLGPPGG
jgi:CRP-like cAMP-binding protein